MIRNTLRKEEMRVALGMAACYALLLIVLPTGIRALERPSVDVQGVRDAVDAQLCDTYPDAARCTSVGGGDGSTDSGSDEGGSGGTDDGGSSDGTDQGGTGTSAGDGTSTGGGSAAHREVTITVRTESSTVTTGTLVLPRAGAPDVSVTPTGGSAAHAVPAQSVLAELLALDDEDDAFTVSDLEYYDSFGAYYVNCITSAEDGELCGGWQFTVNDETPEVGMDGYMLAYGDTVDVFFEPWDAGESTTTDSTTMASGGTGGGGGGLLDGGAEGEQVAFDIPAALVYMDAFTEKDGSYGAPLYTDWVAIARVAAGADTAAVAAYLQTDTVISDHVTDHERRAMALMALHQDASEEVATIRGSFGGVQIGDPALINDDIFGLVVLGAAGYGAEDRVVAGVVAHLLAEQGVNGAWENDTDLTAAAVQALMPYAADGDVAFALGKARVYLRVTQGEDGGFGNAFTTAWVLQTISAYGDVPSDWQKNGNDPLTYLARTQGADGGVLDADTASTTRLWATAYAVPAALGKTWYELMAGAPAVTVTHKTVARAIEDQTASSETSAVATTSAASMLARADTVSAGMSVQPETKSKDTQAQTADASTSESYDQMAAVAETAPWGGVDTRIIGFLVVLLAIVGLGIYRWRKA